MTYIYGSESDSIYSSLATNSCRLWQELNRGDAVQEIPLSEFGLEMVAGVAARKGWSEKAIQNWIRAGLLPAVVLGTGRGATFLVQTSDVEKFVTPPRGRPAKTEVEPAKKKLRK